MNEEHNKEFQQTTPHQEGAENLEAESILDAKEYTTDAETSKNTIIVAVLAIIVVVLALMYLWGSNNEIMIEEQPPLLPDEQTEELKRVSTSDELDVIEEDLMTTETETLDEGLPEMEAELDAELNKS